MSRRAGVAAIGVASVIVAWQLGSLPLAVAGLCGLLAAGLGWGWERRLRGLTLRRDLPTGSLVEGDELRYDVWLVGARLPGSFVLEERPSRGTPLWVELKRAGPTKVVVRCLSRGRLEIGRAALIADDPLGVSRLTQELDRGPVVLVRPRIPLLATLFTEGGGVSGSGRRRAAVGPSGLELRGVREYRDGEPLRAVHWVSTARRGRLMIRELEEPPDHDATVALDLDGTAEMGPPGATSLDEAVRAAGALVRAQLERGRAVRLVVSGAQEQAIVARSLPDWDDILDLLAVVEGRAEGVGAASSSRLDLSAHTILVTARAEAIRNLPTDLRGVVFVDPQTYAGQVPLPALPGLLRLAAHGVPIAVVRKGDDLKTVLEGSLTDPKAVVGG